MAPAVSKLNQDVGELVKEYIDAMEKMKLREGIRLAMSISSLGNKFFQVSHVARCRTASRQHRRHQGPPPQPLRMSCLAQDLAFLYCRQSARRLAQDFCCVGLRHNAETLQEKNALLTALTTRRITSHGH